MGVHNQTGSLARVTMPAVDKYVEKITRYFISDSGLLLKDNGVCTYHWICGGWMPVNFRILDADPPYFFEVTAEDSAAVMDLKMSGVGLAEQKKGVYRVNPPAEKPPEAVRAPPKPVGDPATEAFFIDRKYAALRCASGAPNLKDEEVRCAMLRKMHIVELRERQLRHMGEIECNAGYSWFEEDDYKRLTGYTERKASR